MDGTRIPLPAVLLFLAPCVALWSHAGDGAFGAAVTDYSEGRAIEVGGDRVKRYEYRDTFTEPWYLEDATIDGLSCLRRDGSAPALHIESPPSRRRRVSLTYHFTSPFHTKELNASLEGSIQGSLGDSIELSLSGDGEHFVHATRASGRKAGNPFCLTAVASHRLDGRSFWVRIAATLGPESRATLELFRVRGRVKPPEQPEVALSPSVVSERGAGAWERGSAGAWHP